VGGDFRKCTRLVGIALTHLRAIVGPSTCLEMHDIAQELSDRPLCAAHHHINFVAPAMGTDQPLSPFGNGSLGAVSSRHFGGIGLNLMSAFEAPDDEPNTGSRRAAECHRRAGFGLHLSGQNHTEESRSKSRGSGRSIQSFQIA
jgi:hypothetical protein